MGPHSPVPKLGNESMSIQIWHHHIRHNEIGRRLLVQAERVTTVDGSANAIAFRFQEMRQRLEQGGLIIRDNDRFHIPAP